MPDITELGRKVKAKYPGQYDDLSDDDVGRKVKAKYPGAYDDFTDAPKSAPKRGVAEAEADLLRYDPKGYDNRGRALTPQHEAFERKPYLERKFERAFDEFRAGGLDVSKMARQALGAGMGAAGAVAGGKFKMADFPAWRQLEEERRRELAEREQSRPAPSFGEEVGGGVLRGAPAASGAIGLGIATGGSVPATMALGGGMGAAGADWSKPKQAALETAVGAVAPVVGGKIGQKVGGAIARRLAAPAAQATARAGGEFIGGGTGNVAGALATGERRPRELAKQFAVGAGLNVPGALMAARRPPLPESALPVVGYESAIDPSILEAAATPRPRVPLPTADAGSQAVRGYADTVARIEQTIPEGPQRQAAVEGARRTYRAGRRGGLSESVQANLATPDIQTIPKPPQPEPQGAEASPPPIKPLRQTAELPPPDAPETTALPQPDAPTTQEIPKPDTGRRLIERTKAKAEELIQEGKFDDAINELNAHRQALKDAKTNAKGQRGLRVQLEREFGKAGNRIGEVRKMKREAGRTPKPPPVPAVDDAAPTAEMPAVAKPAATGEPASARPVSREFTNRITEGEGAELPPRVSRPLEGQPVEIPQRPSNETAKSYAPPEQASRQRVLSATDENINQLRQRQEELGRLAYDRRGDFTGDLRDEYNRLTAAIRDYDRQRATPELAPPPGTRQQRMVPPTGEIEPRRAALQSEPTTGMLQASTVGRKVTQETQLPPGLKRSESHATREDARQGHFERFDDQELIAEIARMEDAQNMARRGRSRLTPAEREANNFDLRVAVEMQKERLRIQTQQGREPGERIAPRTPGRTFTKHPETPPVETVAKEPWQMTRGEFEGEYWRDVNRQFPVRRTPVNRRILDPHFHESSHYRNKTEWTLGDIQQARIDLRGRGHITKAKQQAIDLLDQIAPDPDTMRRNFIQRALRESKPVPPEVFADYPDLQPKAATEAPPARKIQHSKFGEVNEAPDQSGVRRGQLRVTDTAGNSHIIRNPRTKGGGNREASFVGQRQPVVQESNEPKRTTRESAPIAQRTDADKELAPGAARVQGRGGQVLRQGETATQRQTPESAGRAGVEEPPAKPAVGIGIPAEAVPELRARPGPQFPAAPRRSDRPTRGIAIPEEAMPELRRPDAPRTTEKPAPIPKKVLESSRETAKPTTAESSGRSILEPSPAGIKAARGEQASLKIPRASKEHAVRYEVRELSDIQPSHDPHTFQVNPRYNLVNDRDYTAPANRIDVEEATKAGAFDSRLVLTDDPTATNGPPIIIESGDVLGGNSRTMMLGRIYKNHPSDAQKYRDALKKRAGMFGLDPAALDGFKEPVLVRVIEGTPDNLQRLITDLNVQPGKAMSATEAGSARARQLPPDTMQYLADKLAAEGPEGTLANALEGIKGVKVLNRLIDDGIIPKGERNRYLSDQGNLMQSAKAEIETMLLGRLFRDADQMKRAAPEMRNKLARIAPHLAKMAGTEWDVSNLVPNAIEATTASKAQKIGLDELNQRGFLFGERAQYLPEELAIARLLKDSGPRQVENFFRRYATEFEGAQKGQGLFGDPPSQKEVFADVFQLETSPRESKGTVLGSGLGGLQGLFGRKPAADQTGVRKGFVRVTENGKTFITEKPRGFTAPKQPEPLSNPQSAIRNPQSAKPAPSSGRDVNWFDYLRSPLSNLNFKGTYERLAGSAGKEISESFRKAQLAIARDETVRGTQLAQLERTMRGHKQQLRAEGKPGLANWLDEHVRALEDPDAAFRGLAGFLKKFQYDLKLRHNPRSIIVNELQPLQTLWPHLTTREFLQITVAARRKATRTRIKEIAQRESGGKVEEVDRGKKKLLPDVFSKVSDSNRIMGHLAGELMADKMGLTGEAKARMAADWAQKVEFDNSRWNAPPLFRGRIAGVVGQFKPFIVKNIERLHADWKAQPEGSESGNLARRAKMITSQLAIGGVRSALLPGVKEIGGVLILGGLANAFRKSGMEEDSANRMAEALYFGAPGLVEQDLSSSVTLLDSPFGNTPSEKAVNFLGGPTISLIVKAWKEGETMAAAKDADKTREEKVKASALRLAKAVTPYTKTAQSIHSLATTGKAPKLRLGKDEVEMTKPEAIGYALMGSPLRQTKHYEEEEAFDWQKRMLGRPQAPGRLSSFGSTLDAELKKHNLDYSRVDEIPGDTEKTHRARSDKVEQWMRNYGSALAASPRYKALSASQQKAALESLRRRIGGHANEKAPRLTNLSPADIIQSVRQSERGKPMRDRGKIVVAPD